MCVCYTRELRGEKRNSCWCLFELWPNPTWGGCVGARSLCTKPQPLLYPQPDTHTYCTHSGTGVHTQILLFTHTHLPVHPSHIKVCLSFHAHHFRSSPSRYFPLFPTDTHTFSHTHTATEGACLWADSCEALALITCSSESLSLTLWPSPSPGTPFALLCLLSGF